LTTVQGLPKKFDQKKILKVIKKKFGTSSPDPFAPTIPGGMTHNLVMHSTLTASDCSTACNGTIVNDSEMGEVIQLQGDQRKDVQEFLIDKKEGLELDPKTIKVHGF
jgi:translation initiation factor 1